MKFQSVLSIAPLRISFLGGGTDIRSFYEKFGGSVVSCAINKYVYVHIKKHDPLFQERYRISYSDVEHTNDRDKINNKIVKACLEYLNMDEPLQISTSGDAESDAPWPASRQRDKFQKSDSMSTKVLLFRQFIKTQLSIRQFIKNKKYIHCNSKKL
jgi:hypothetical protein